MDADARGRNADRAVVGSDDFASGRHTSEVRSEAARRPHERGIGGLALNAP